MLASVVFIEGFSTTPKPGKEVIVEKIVEKMEKNPCEDSKPYDAQFTSADGTLDESRTIKDYFKNRNCAEMMDTGFAINLPQAGMDVTKIPEGEAPYGAVDYTGTPLEGAMPIMDDYAKHGMCAVNVHWHLGAEHKSLGQYDETGKGPGGAKTGDMARRQLAMGIDEEHEDIHHVRLGLQCHHYDETDAKFTTPYDWKYCKGLDVGQTYEVHWPHSAAGSCGDKWQYQYPFYDGVFCKPGVISLGDNPPFNVHTKIGVEGQVFTIVNSEDVAYQHHGLFWGAWKDATHWADVGKYLGSTTGTSRDNEVCSMYAPITWQVDRTCHMVSAASFDEMCRVMSMQADDMSEDLHAHGARELVAPDWAINSLHRKKE